MISNYTSIICLVMKYSIKECWLVQYTERRALFLPLYFSVQIRKFCSWNELVLINELNYLVPYDIHIVILFI